MHAEYHLVAFKNAATETNAKLEFYGHIPRMFLFPLSLLTLVAQEGLLNQYKGLTVE